MARTHMEIIEGKLINGERLPNWATQDGIMAAFDELAADLESGLLLASQIVRQLDTLKTAARQFRCLECYERIVQLLL